MIQTFKEGDFKNAFCNMLFLHRTVYRLFFGVVLYISYWLSITLYMLYPTIKVTQTQ